MDTRNAKLDQPSCVLLCGKTEILDQEILELISQYYRVVVTGKGPADAAAIKKPSGKINLYQDDIISENFPKLVHSYTPDVIWYFSGFCDGGEGFDDEYGKIVDLYAAASANEVRKIVIISSINSLNYTLSHNEKGNSEKHYVNQKAFGCAKMEEMASYCSKASSIKTVTLRVPYVLNLSNKGTYMGTLFEKITHDKAIELPYNEKQNMDLLSDKNLAEVLISVTEEVMDVADDYVLLSGFDHTYADFGEKLHECRKDMEVGYADSFYDLVLNRKSEGERLRKNYGFINGRDPFDDIQKRYEEYNRTYVKKSAFREKAGKLLKKLSGNTYKILELVLLFILVQVLLPHTTNSVFFRYVDIRLFFVVILGITHGMFVGILAGILECISLIVSYSHEGVTGTT
nr:hypothetical protein [Lachnospiraceae bacterium]